MSSLVLERSPKDQRRCRFGSALATAKTQRRHCQFYERVSKRERRELDEAHGVDFEVGGCVNGSVGREEREEGGERVTLRKWNVKREQRKRERERTNGFWTC